MAEIRKLAWITLTMFLVVVYLVGALFIEDEFTSKERSMENQAVLLSNRKDALMKEEINLVSIKESLQQQLLDAKDENIKKELTKALKRISLEQRRREIEDNLRLLLDGQKIESRQAIDMAVAQADAMRKMEQARQRNQVEQQQESNQVVQEVQQTPEVTRAS